MYQIIFSNNFKKQSRKIIKSGQCPREKIENVIDILASGELLKLSLHNHKLQGKYNGLYECHIRPDVLLIYEKDEKLKLITLVALGSHNELFK